MNDLSEDAELQAVAGPHLSTLLRLFGSGARERGERYARGRRVAELSVESDPQGHPGWTVDAEVLGSTGTYNTWLDLSCDEQGQWWFGEDCDCPVDGRCKHVVALLCTLAQRHPEIVTPHPPANTSGQPLRTATLQTPPPSPASTRQREADQWLARTRLMTSASAPTAERREDHVIFMLLEEQRSQGAVRLTLRPARSRLLKKTGLPGRMQTLQSNQFHSFQSHADDPDLVFLLENLEAMQHLSGSRWHPLPWGTLAGTLAQPTLERLLTSGRVFSAQPDGTPSPPWRWAAPRALAWAWHKQGEASPDGESWRLEPVVASDDPGAGEVRFYPAQPGFYADHGTRSLGLLDLQGASLSQVQQWREAPPMSAAWLRDTPELREFLPLLPAEVAPPVVRSIRGVPPRPVLSLYWPERVDGQAHAPQAKLWFDHDGLRTAPWPAGAGARQFIEHSEGVVELHRDLDAEAEAGRAWARFATQMDDLQTRRRPAHVWQLGGPGLPDALTTLAGWMAQDFEPLRELGFEVEFDSQWADRIRQADQIEARLDDAGAGGWLALSLGFDLDGQRIDLLPLLPQVLAGLNLSTASQPDRLPPHFWVQTADGDWWQLPSAPLQPWLAVLIELLDEREEDLRSGRLSLSPVEALRLGADEANFGRQGLAALREVLAPRHPGATLPASPPGLQADLRPYQQQGWAWMQALARHRLGGLLADDMGLGKTLQTLTHLLDEKTSGRSRYPSLVVVPTSLLGNWQRECERFTPTLRMLVLHGQTRHTQFSAIQAHDVVLTTYPLLQRDLRAFGVLPWHALVLDEAQTLKNARTLTAKAARAIPAQHRIALTGTPMENHLGELWALMDLVLPGYLGREPRFAALYRGPIEKQRDADRLTLLQRRLAPFMLRRDKRLVAAELPPKIEQVVQLPLGSMQANLYETIRAAAKASVQKALAAKGLARSQIFVLDALLKLRQACCDPRLLKLAQGKASTAAESAKLSWLLDALPQLLEEGRRVLLFSQFTSMLTLIEASLSEAGLSWTKLTGDTADREAAIARFTSGEVPLFLISLKAGGTGLNLPQADTVIHFDPWWNPAVENQATDRAHRLGQTQTVFVYKLVAEGTLEERILAMQDRKAELARSVQGDGNADDTSAGLSEADLNWLLQPLGAATATPPTDSLTPCALTN